MQEVQRQNADVALIELGGTVGEYEGLLFSNQSEDLN